jgi:hypothetical protein
VTTRNADSFTLQSPLHVFTEKEHCCLERRKQQYLFGGGLSIKSRNFILIISANGSLPSRGQNIIPANSHEANAKSILSKIPTTLSDHN